jgi:hypothetical protein
VQPAEVVADRSRLRDDQISVLQHRRQTGCPAFLPAQNATTASTPPPSFLLSRPTSR